MPIRRATVKSLAKINLDLRVLNQRSDGFHELRTVFQTISLADTIDIEYQPGRTSIDINSNLNIPDNLIVSAAHSVLKATRSTGRIATGPLEGRSAAPPTPVPLRRGQRPSRSSAHE